MSNPWDPKTAFQNQNGGAIPATPTTVPPTTTAPVIPATNPLPLANPTVVPGTQPMHEDLSGDDYAGVGKSVTVGDKYQRFPISKFKGVVGQIKRVACLFSNNWLQVDPHWVDGVGRVYCWGGSCCEPKGPAKPYWLVPVVAYTDANYQTGEFQKDGAGNLIIGGFEITYLALYKELYEMLSMLHFSYPLNTVDLKISCTDSKMQKLQMAPAGPAVWRQNEELAKAVIARYHEVKSFMVKDFGRKIGKTFADQESAYAKMKQQSAEWAAKKSSQSQQQPQGGYTGGGATTHQQPQATNQPSTTAAPINKDFDIDSLLNQ